MSEGICVEGAFIVEKEQNPWHELSIVSCCLICIGLCCIVSMFTSAAVWAQAVRFGKGRKEIREKFEEKKRKRKMADEGNIPQEVRDLQPPSEPRPTEEGSETMEKRAKELKQQALEAKAAREIALEKALEEKAVEEKENPTESGEASVEKSSGSTLEKGKEVEADKEKEDENEGEEEETECSEDEESSSEEEENRPNRLSLSRLLVWKTHQLWWSPLEEIKTHQLWRRQK